MATVHTSHRTSPGTGADPGTGTGTGTANGPAARGSRRPLTRSAREAVAGWLFVAPSTLGMLVFLVVPMAASVVVSFFRVSGFGDQRFVGLENYRRLLHDPVFGSSLATTGLFTVLFVPLLFTASLGLALLLQKRRPLIGLWRSLVFAPHVVSLVVVGLVWQFLLTDHVGVVNRVLDGLGLPAPSWLGNPAFALPAVVLISVWFFMGYYMVIFLNGLNDIPASYYEAARIDGAGRWRSFRHVTWPLLRPTSLFVLVMTTLTAIGAAGVFDLIYVMTKGGPDYGTQVVMFYIYQRAFQLNDFGYSSAMAAVVSALLLLVMFVMLRLTRGGKVDA